MLSTVGRLARNRSVAAASSRRSHVLPRADVFHVVGALQRDGDDDRRRLDALPRISAFHTSAAAEYRKSDVLGPSGVSLALGAGAVSAASFAALSAVRAYREWKEGQPEAPPAEEETTAKADDEQEQQQPRREEAKGDGSKQESDGNRENVFAKWFDVGGKYYEGGFEDKMTRREAALILGVRESSSAQRVKEAHRKLLILNHPDTGGSTYLSGKINEAKELLLKNKR